MRILIVNGYQKNQLGFKKFSEFQYIIMKILSEQKELVDTETEFFIRDKDNLDDFLYEIESSNLKKEAANNFDQLDIVFVSGDMNVRPWSKSMRKVLTIIRMCLKVNKYLYTCSWGFQALVFLCASNLEKNINVINGQGNGTKLSEIHEMKKIINTIKQNDYFLDNTTGDLYGFNFETNEWVPKAQCGIHYRRSAEEFQSIGKYILKAPVYKANIEHKEKYGLFKSRKYEDLCTIKKIHLHHWAFEGMDSEFLVPLKNAWDTHTFAFLNPNKKFSVLADSARGPLVIELSNIISTQFDINPKYPNTLIPIKNFIHLSLKYIKSGQNQQQSISNYHNMVKDSSINEILVKQKTQYKRKALKLLQERTAQMGFTQSQRQKQKMSSIKDKDGDDEDDEDDGNFKHVGFSAKKQHQPNVVNRNLVQETKYKISGEKIVQSLMSSSNQNLQHLQKKTQNQKQVKIISRQNSNNNVKTENNQVGFVDMEIGDSVQAEEMNLNDEYYSDDDDNEKMRNQLKLQSNLKNGQRSSTSHKNRIYDPNTKQEILLTKGSVRKKLHPRISSDFIKNEPLWVPGQLSQSSNTLKRGILQKESFKDTKIPKHYAGVYGQKKSSFYTSFSNTSKSTLTRPQTRPGRDFGEFHSIFDGPWLSQDEIQKLQQKEKDKLIIAGPFKNKTKKIDFFQQEGYLKEPNNVFNYQHRSFQKKKWIGGEWKVCV